MVTMTLNDQWTLSLGDPVYTTDGHRLGEVTRSDPYEIEVENGLFFRRCYVLTHAELDRYEHGALIASITLAEAKARACR